MKNKIEHSENKKILVKYLLGEASEEEKSMALRLINSDEGWRNYFDTIRKTHYAIEYAYAKEKIDVNSQFEKFRNHIREQSENVQLNTTRRLLSYIPRIAAVLVIAIGIGIWYFSQDQTHMISVRNSGEQVLYDTLHDGTIVSLNTNSKIVYPDKFDSDRREVAISGEVFFEVSEQQDNPFIVSVNDFRVKVTGTSFNINAYDKENIKVGVTSGKVFVYSQERSSEKIMLKKGEMGIYSGPDTVISKKEADQDINNQLAWKTGVLEFDNTKMSQVIKTLEDHFDVEIKIENKKINDCKVTSRFENKSLKFIFKSLEITFNFEVVKKGEKTYLFKGEEC